jgi:hypothetical protein
MIGRRDNLRERTTTKQEMMSHDTEIGKGHRGMSDTMMMLKGEDLA